jgi:CRP-like cAMP-binding protein
MYSCPLFAGLSRQECIDVVSCAFARSFARDEFLFVQGQPVRDLILLESGHVKHTQVSQSGKEALLRISATGDLVCAQPEAPGGHTCSARATEKCEALVWKFARMQDLLTRYPQLRTNFDRILVAQLQELEERFREVATERVAGRLALVLLRLLRQIGKQSGDGVQVQLSREELAQMTGATVFTISRVLSRWSEEGIILARRSRSWSGTQSGSSPRQRYRAQARLSCYCPIMAPQLRWPTARWTTNSAQQLHTAQVAP